MHKILVVNNDFDTMTLLQAWLERKNYKVKYTGVVEEVPHIVRDFKPDLVLIDVLESQVAEELKMEGDTRELPVLLMTGYTLSKKTSNAVNVDDTIEKPFNLNLLEKKIAALIRA